MCLADVYGIVFLMSGGAAAIVMLVVAMGLEWPLLARLWSECSPMVTAS